MCQAQREENTMQELERIGHWWRAANYLTAAQLYLRENPLLRRPL